MEQIAIVRLAPGQVGYYDELSRIHLTIGSPERAVYKGTNCTQLRRSVKSGRLKLISGSLGAEEKPKKIIKPDNSISVGNFIPKTSSVKKEVKTTTQPTNKPEVKKEQVSSVKSVAKKEAVSVVPNTNTKKNFVANTSNKTESKDAKSTAKEATVNTGSNNNKHNSSK